MEHVFYQCPACTHLLTERTWKGIDPDAPCPHCQVAVAAQFQRRVMRVKEKQDGRNQ